MGIRVECILIQPFFKVGDPRPESYLSWHEWAAIQYKGGLRQARDQDGEWKFPQELRGKAKYARRKRGDV